jgi:hypothetical protein
MRFRRRTKRRGPGATHEVRKSHHDRDLGDNFVVAYPLPSCCSFEPLLMLTAISWPESDGHWRAEKWSDNASRQGKGLLRNTT